MSEPTDTTPDSSVDDERSELIRHVTENTAQPGSLRDLLGINTDADVQRLKTGMIIAGTAAIVSTASIPGAAAIATYGVVKNAIDRRNVDALRRELREAKTGNHRV